MAYHMDSELDALAGEVRAMSIYQGKLRAYSSCRDPEHPGCEKCEPDTSAEDEARDVFLAACKAGDANAIAMWAPKSRDTSNLKTLGSYDKCPKRYQTVGEVIYGALYEPDGNIELVQLLLNVAYGADLVNAPAMARALLSRAAREFAREVSV